MRVCKHCQRGIVNSDDRWVDPEATGDDSIWRETCEGHDTFTAEHEPEKNECTTLLGHLPGQDHRWQECPTYHDGEN